MWNRALRQRFNFCFFVGFLLVLKKLWEEEWAVSYNSTRLGFEIFLIFPNFLSSVVPQIVKQLVDTMFITNNYTSFHVWSNLVKHQKVSNYCGHDCSKDVRETCFENKPKWKKPPPILVQQGNGLSRKTGLAEKLV